MSTLATLQALAMTLLFGGAYAESYCVANDLDQARVAETFEVKSAARSTALFRRFLGRSTFRRTT